MIAAIKELSARILVTGAAGFIGSHLTERLLDRGREVVGLDNLSSGDKANLAHVMKDRRFHFFEADLLDIKATRRVLAQCELVFHLAADPEVRAGEADPETHFRQNLQATFNLLEAIRKRATPTKLVFASTSTVYGEASVIPTPEDYGPLLPISTYGATKLGCEALAVSYAELLPLQVVAFRFANIVGSRAKHGVLYDFIMKLRRDPRKLEVLGDGKQTKSYLHIDDCVDAFLMTLDEGFWRKGIEVYNIGSEDQTNVLTIAFVVAEAMGLREVALKTTQSTGGRAWPGDVRMMSLDITKIKEATGWNPKTNSDGAVRAAVDQLLRNSRP